MSDQSLLSANDARALQQLGLRYARAIDRRDGDLLVSLFTNNGSIGSADTDQPAYKGHVDLRRMLKQVDRSFGPTMHGLSNQLFEQAEESDHASGETYCDAQHIVVQKDGSWLLLRMAVRYLDHYRKEDGIWRIARRRIKVEWVGTSQVGPFNRDLSALTAFDMTT